MANAPLPINDPSIQAIEALEQTDALPLARPNATTPMVATLAVLFNWLKARLDLGKLDRISESADHLPLWSGAVWPGSIDHALNTAADLAAIPTRNLPVKITTRLFINTDDDALQCWQLRASASRNKPADGVVRPADYDTATNQKAWHRVL